jgi:hypothetical protein
MGMLAETCHLNSKERQLVRQKEEKPTVGSPSLFTQEYIINLIIGTGFPGTPMITKVYIC